MVFATTNLFKGIACPESERCQLTSCIFSHDSRPQASKAGPKTAEAVEEPKEPASKRRKITAVDRTERSLSKSDQIREQLAADRRGGPESHSRPLPSLEKPVTPPPRNGKRATNTTSSDQAGDNSRQQSATTRPLDSEPKENLNPRLIPADPVGHAKRTLYLKHLHTEMVKLNQRVADAKDRVGNWKVPMLTEQELIRLALDEEEALAKDHGQLYPNKVKQRIASYKKMDIDEWIAYAKANVIGTQIEVPKKPDPDQKVITTGLTSDEEVLILPYLIADQTNLAQYGYVPVPPTAAEAAKAQEEVDFSKNYEKCDRCGANFQVFPDRNTDGLLTSNGPCKFHPNRKVPSPKTKNDYHGGVKLPYHPCCNEVEGNVGCTTHESHVFKIDPVARARLAAVLPFINTPENPSPSKDKQGTGVKAVSFDCEMGYTTCGLELIRLTAVNWPSGEELVDVLVKPVGTIIDLNSRFSGVFPEHFAKAIPYGVWKSYVPSPPAADDNTASPTTQVLPVVPSISAARALLTSFLTPKTPLIGHAIDNDLNVTRLCHPTIIDTILLFRHPRGPLPLRMGLKALSLQYLGKRIQQGGDRGHDSAEDARATGELVRVKVKERWAQLQRAGCEISEGKLGRHDGDGVWRSLEELESGDFGTVGGELAKKLMDGFGNGGGGGKKRKKGPKANAFGMDGAADEDGDAAESTEQESERTAPGGNGIAAFLPKA